MRAVRWIVVVALAGCAGGGDGGDDKAKDGTDAPSGIDPASFAGDWSGTWNNTTFDSTGAATMTVTVDTGAKTATVVLDLDGGVFGMADPDGITMDGTYDDSGFTVSGTNDLFGATTLTFSSDGTITGSGAPMVSASVDTVEFDGTGDDEAIELDYTIHDDGGSLFAEGTFDLTKD